MTHHHTHDPSLRSWIPVPEHSDFPIQNLPFGVFRPSGETARVGMAIGNSVVDLAALDHEGLFEGTLAGGQGVFAGESLNAFMGLGRAAWSEVRDRLSDLLAERGGDAPPERKRVIPAVHDLEAVELLLPAAIADYTDFYSSIEHATNMGKMFRDPKNALLPNWRHIPVGYNGRASSVVVSGTPIKRPHGQTKADDAELPSFGPSRLLDIELEMGFLTGLPTALGEPIPIERTPAHICGMVLLNDWSARDIQKWEYVPLGPFLGKSFGTTISPWVVSLDALEPFRVDQPKQEPPVLPYLREPEPGAYDIELEVLLLTPSLDDPVRIAHTNFRRMYWTIYQQLAHQTVNGTNIRPGDLYGSGTVSGPTEDSFGSLLELTWRGTKPIELPNGETRKFLQDGDTVILRGWCQGVGYRIGFGECRGTITPAG